jgi:hypothetical protein
MVRLRLSSLRRAASGAVLLVLLASGSTLAHHASSIYDRENHITLRGTVTEYAFTSPHVRILFEAKGETGASERWVALSAPPQRLYRSGWNGQSLKAGDEITVTGAPMKDGSHVLNVRRLVSPSGQVLTEGAD